MIESGTQERRRGKEQVTPSGPRKQSLSRTCAVHSLTGSQTKQVIPAFKWFITERGGVLCRG